MIDSLLTEQRITELLTSSEWIEYKRLDLFNNANKQYFLGPNIIWKFNRNNKFEQKSNSIFPKQLLSGNWRFVKSSLLIKARFQRETRYDKFIQGTIITLDSVNNPELVGSNIDTIDINKFRKGYDITFVSDKEFFLSTKDTLSPSVTLYFNKP
ncbi:MAG: hypothetical protein EAZ92_01100 [Candidatus Kapaibacterium sp.]|nr:MAG: hypothetical protein EAZ92_01100 [Candidatus Kapabacteria bacterium]